jgi:hypothetical protein
MTMRMMRLVHDVSATSVATSPTDLAGGTPIVTTTEQVPIYSASHMYVAH